MKPAAKLGIAVAALGVFGGLMILRREANGLRNVVNPQYWKERSVGFDLYSPEKHMLKGGRRDKKQILLTIDDGPHDKTMDFILDTLKAEHVPALFFVVGKNVAKHPALVKRMIDEGHEVGNHTYDHLRLTTLSADKMRSQIDLCAHAIEKATGRTTTLLRPPGMDFNEDVIKEIQTKGYTTVHWTVAAKDFVATVGEGKMTSTIQQTLSTKPEDVVERVMKQVKNGSIILLHDLPITSQAIPTVIKRCKEAGYEFISAKEMLANLPKPVVVESNPKATSKVASSGDSVHHG